MDENSSLRKLGFITQKDLSHLGMKDMVAVYCPHSYNFSGNLFVVPRKNVSLIHNVSSSDFMKFVVSGGVSGFPAADDVEAIVEGKHLKG